MLFFALMIVAAFCCACFHSKKDTIITEQPQENKNIKTQATQVKQKIKENKENKRFELYTNSPYEMPLFSITEISKLPQETTKKIDTLFEEGQGFFLLKNNRHNDSALIILQNPISKINSFPRHEIEIVKVSQNSQKTKDLGYLGEKDEISDAINKVESNNDIWEYDNSLEHPRPLKHKNYDEFGAVNFTETWNYNDSEPIKYEYKDKHDKVISVRKETFENETNYRREHVFYDENGNIKISISITYDGANIVKFTYFDAEDPQDSVTIITEYLDGNKIAEKIYNSEYQLQNIIKAKYENSTRKQITVYDAEEKELYSISD